MVIPLSARSTYGSSPRTWGTLASTKIDGMWRRFIPTYMGNAGKHKNRWYVETVHPHVHGERIHPAMRINPMAGSSPRTWGTHEEHSARYRFQRFIPTYMGNAAPFAGKHQIISVHPHVHGECTWFVSREFYTLGSSPRTWGTLPQGPTGNQLERFIPTYMGNASTTRRSAALRSVHPHVHGERCSSRHIRSRAISSSPRTWGTLKDHRGRRPLLRFIPTYMGNARGSRTAPSRAPVHPHVHGERHNCAVPFQSWGGSSPRTWGTLYIFGFIGMWHRFIPTYMGNARHCSGNQRRTPVHPHVHGERQRIPSATSPVIGSSPRTWGTPGRFGCDRRRYRFIPTYMGNATGRGVCAGCAAVHPHVHGERRAPDRAKTPAQRFIPTYMGNASRPATRSVRVSVHPHVHGERRQWVFCKQRVSGSSPRTWGTRRLWGMRWIYSGFIPTYMGNAAPGEATRTGAPVHPHVHGERM